MPASLFSSSLHSRFIASINFLSIVLFTLALSYAIIVFHCLTVVSVSLCSLIKAITPKIRVLCFVLINSVLFNLLYAWIFDGKGSAESLWAPLLGMEADYTQLFFGPFLVLFERRQRSAAGAAILCPAV